MGNVPNNICIISNFVDILKLNLSHFWYKVLDILSYAYMDALI